MRILLYAPPFYSLHSQIIEELELMGHTVGFVPDKIYKFDPFFGSSPLRIFKKILKIYFDSKRNIIKDNKKLLSQSWDILLCINGYSYNEEIYKYLKRSNLHIKSILYLWDSLNFYDFSKNFKLFDKIISFDPEDCKRYNIQYKPLFYSKKGLSSPVTTDIDLSFIGTQHTLRYRLLSKIKAQLKASNLNYKFYLVVSSKKLTLLDHLKYILYYFRSTASAIGFKDEYLIKKGKIKDDIVKFEPLSDDKVVEIINRSKCIVDIAKPDQNGFTNRMIESLGRKKRIITNIKSVRSYNSGVIQYLDENNPVIDVKFINGEIDDSYFEIYNELRIDKWLSFLINQ